MLLQSGSFPTSHALINNQWIPGGIHVNDSLLTSYGEKNISEKNIGDDGIAIPGFIDLQVNGHGGMDLLAAESVADIKKVSRSLYANGVIGYLPTLITGPLDQTLKVISLIESAKREYEPGEAKILGIHLEGPFISTLKPGVHPLEYFRNPDNELMGNYLRAGTITLVTLAPELPGAIELITYLTSMGVVVSLGHSNATAEEAHAGFNAGARTVTHLWNGMPAMTKRDPGLVGVALERDDVAIQIIVDSVHVAPEIIAMSLQQAHNRFIVTNDAVAPAGLGSGKFPFGTFTVEVRNGVAVRDDGVIAGGVEVLSNSLNQIRSYGISRDECIASMTARPAALIGQDYAGLLDLGSPVQIIPA